MQRLFGYIPGKNPEDISAYEGRTGPASDLTVYGYGTGLDLEKSQRLKKYREKYGAALDNKIIAENMRLFAGSPRFMYQSPSGLGMLADAQDRILAELDAAEEYKERQEAEKRGWTLREASQRQKNPMMY